MFTDMVGYTALGQRNEALSLTLVEEQRKVIRPILARHGGREVKTIGDAFLVEFPNAVEAVRCGYDIQRAIREFNLSLPIDRRVSIRVGIHVGEIVEDQGDISGGAVNLASRIEPLAEEGGVCVTRPVYELVKNKVDIPMSSIGPKTLKNVLEPMEVFRMEMPWTKESSPQQAQLNRKRIAVLPFTNMSSNPEEGYFADGMTEELITSLSGIRQLTVIARTSVMGYKGTSKKVKEIGGELEVGTVLEGSVRKAGDRVRITAQLIDTATEGHLWAQNYDRQLQDVFAIQSEIAEKVAGELKIQLVTDEKATLEKKATDSTDAYTCYLKGKDLVREGTESSMRRATSLFDKAIELDPRFARAYEGLAECYMTLANDGYESIEQAAPKAEMAAKKALLLDPQFAEAHATMAYVHFLEDRVTSCEIEARRALELNPSISEGYRELAFIALLKGDGLGGMKLLETAWRLDPLRSFYIERLGQLYFYLGNESDAVSFWEKTVDMAPAATYRTMTEYNLQKGDLAKAKEYFDLAEKHEPAHHWVVWMRGFLAAKMGDREGATKALKEVEENWKGGDSLNQMAFIYYGLGDLDSYFTYVNKAADQHILRFIWVMYSPAFAAGREDPRYKLVLEKVASMMVG